MNYLKILDEILNNNNEAYDSLTIISKDGTIEYVKRLNAFLDMASYDRNRIGKHIFEAFPGLDENCNTMTALRTGKITKTDRQTLSCGNIKVIASSTMYPIIDENGEIQGAVDAIKYLEYFNYGGRDLRKNEEILDNIISENQKMKKIKENLPSIAKNDSNVFIYGETGTGKEIFAQSIHLLSNRKNEPFITQNCAAIPANLMESTFFGTETGGFTGAEKKQGLFELANRGTLFLDEINSMDFQMQAKLLTALEEKKVRKIGGQKNIPFDVRIICASNEEAKKLIYQGRLRTDFYYRISVVKVNLPPLRERLEDIVPLSNHFIKMFNKRMNRNITGISPMALEMLYEWSWPGNVRELRSVIESAFNVETSKEIKINSIIDLLEEMGNDKNKTVMTEDDICVKSDLKNHSKNISEHNLSEIKEMLKKGNIDIEMLLETYERCIIEEAMRQNRKLKAVAETLSISPQKLNYRMQKLNIK